MHQKMYMYKRIVEAKLFIDSHFQEQIDLNKIANSAHYSKFHFLRLFKKAFGKSPAQHLRDMRLAHAKKLLQSQKSVADVCFAVGFESIPSFSILFKKQVGVSPKEYQMLEFAKQKQVKAQPLHFIPNCFAENFNLKKSNSQ